MKNFNTPQIIAASLIIASFIIALIFCDLSQLAN